MHSPKLSVVLHRLPVSTDQNMLIAHLRIHLEKQNNNKNRIIPLGVGKTTQQLRALAILLEDSS